MESPNETAPTLEYGRPAHKPSLLSEAWWTVFVCVGILPFVIELVALWLEATTGDPPNSLREFKAYHYATVSAALIATSWFAWLLIKFRGHERWWLVALCGVWFGWVLWVGFWFLWSLHDHPAGQYYWSNW